MVVWVARLGLAALAFVCAPSVARAEGQVPVRWDCFLDVGPLTCRSLATSYFGSMTLLVPRADGGAAPPCITAKVRAREVLRGVEYQVGFDDPAQRLAFTLTERVPSALTASDALVRVAGVLQRGSVVFLRSGGVVRDDDGRLHLPLTVPAGATSVAPSTEGDAGGWYLEPRLAGELVRAGVFVAAASAALEVNYSDSERRLRGGGHARYQRLRLDVGDGQVLEGDVLGGEAYAVFAETVHGGLSVASTVGVEHAPQNNLDLEARAGAGVEWVAVPMLEPGSLNVGVRYEAGVTHQDYVTANLDQAGATTLPVHEAIAFFRDHGTVVDVALEAFAAAPITEPAYWSVGGEVKLDVRLGGGVELGVRGRVAVRDASLQAPADPDGIDRVAQLVAGNDYGRFTMGTELTLAYAFGDSLLAARDQRWQ